MKILHFVVISVYVYLCHVFAAWCRTGVSTGIVGTLTCFLTEMSKERFAQRSVNVCLSLVECHGCVSWNAVSGTLRCLREAC